MLLRVFPIKTNLTPIDNYVRIGKPDLRDPDPSVSEVRISVCFTWHREIAEVLKERYKLTYPNIPVIEGGPAYQMGFVGDFTPNLYVKKGITFTTRGCNLKCPWCMVDKIEGKFRELPDIIEGKIVQDNNILLANKEHLDKVFQMLRKQKAIRFNGGLDCRLLKDWHIGEFQKLRIKELWLAFDDDNRIKDFKTACEKLKRAGFSKDKIRCYVLTGFNGGIRSAETRLKTALECGALPFVQLYQTGSNIKRMAGEKQSADNLWIRQWSRPAAIKSIMKEIIGKK